MLNLGFTGTSRGLSLKQAYTLNDLLQQLPNFTIHHGDCVGADAHFDSLARTCLGFEAAVIYPANLDGKRAFCTVGPRDFVKAPMGPLQRNEKIVQASDWLLACPKEDQTVLRSGTWTTVRYALKAKKEVKIILPDGQLVPWTVQNS